MAFQINAELHYAVSQRSTVLLNIHALSTEHQTLCDESFQVTPGVHWEELPLAVGENRYIRLATGDVKQLDIAYSTVATARHTLVCHDEIHPVSTAQINRSAVPYLFPSRYRQSDRLGRLAMKMFAGIPHPYDQVVAIADWRCDAADGDRGVLRIG